jgi:Holliday junction DNA helicase RuvA
MSADEIVTAIRTNNLVRLTSIPGVGKKTAERMVVELRDKISELALDTAARGAAVGGIEQSTDAVFDDALSALVNLGYQRNAAEKALQDSAKDGAEISVQKLLRAALQRLAK